jgi:MFS family permease
MSELTKPKLLDRPAVQVGLFLPVIILMSGDLGVLIANQVLIMADLNITFQQYGLIIGLQYLVNGFFTFFFGYMSDRWSRKKLLILGASGWVIASALSGWAPTYGWLFFARMLSAVGLAAQAPVAFSLLSDIFPSENRSNGFAWWGIANLIGSLGTGGIALSFNRIDFKLLDTMFGTADESVLLKVAYIQATWPELAALWRIPLFLIACLGAAFTLLVFLIREPKRAAKEKALKEILANEEVDYSVKYKIQPKDLQYIVKRKSNMFMVMNFFDTITSGIITAYLFSYLSLDLGINLNFTHINADIIILVLALLIAVGIALWGQFYFSKRGDRQKAQGDILGRIKMMVFCALFQIPFLSLAFLISPSFGTLTIFNGAVQLTPVTFSVIVFVMFILVGLGLAGSFGGTPNWYASLIDGNLPEHRGTMIAVASLMDTIGRSTGAIVGGYFLGVFQGDIGMMLVITNVIFGLMAAGMTIPILITGKKEFPEVEAILEQRAKELAQEIEKKAK